MPHDEFDVVIVGAGAAGIAAARRLAGTGLTVLGLEARDRVGGRAWTAEVEGHAVDLGCGWLHSAEDNPLAPLATELGFAVDKAPPPWSREDAYVGPRRATLKTFQAAMARLDERIEAYPRGGKDADVATLLEPEDPANPMLDAVSTYYSGAELDKVSIIDLANYNDTGVNWRVREGLGAVVARLAQGAPFRLNTPVRRIDRTGPRLSLETPAGVVRARAAIVTLPSTVLAQSPDLFSPALPEKTSAAEGLPLGLANKLYMAVAGDLGIGPDTRTFGRSDSAATGAYHFRPFGRPLVEGYFGGEAAAALEREGLASAWAFAREELTGVFGANFVAKLRPIAFHGWRGDPLARGSYSYARPGRASARLTLAAPVEERIFFAGEACSVHNFTTAHGAYESGIKAAEEVLTAAERK